MKALDLIAEARQAAVDKGYHPEHDDLHTDGSIAEAAGALCVWAKGWWPWEDGWPTVSSLDVTHQTNEERIAILATAGSLIVAEIERLQRRVEQGEQ